jgi:hypothetical protein
MGRILFLSISLLVFFAESVGIANPFGFSETAFKFSLESSYFNTKANLDPNGNTVNLVNGNQVTEMRFNLSGSYDFTDRMGAFANVILNDENDATTGINRSNVGFSQGTVGLGALVFSGFMNIVPEASLTVPFSAPPDLTTTAALLGDSAFVGTGKINLTKSFKYFGLLAYGGYNYLSNGLSANIPYGFKIHGALSSFFSDFGINGISSLGTDQNGTNYLVRQQITNVVDGGSLIYDATNPSWVNLDFDLGARVFRNYQISAGVETTLSGQNTAQGTRFLVTLAYNYWPPRSRITTTPTETGDSSSDQGFRVDTNAEDNQTNPAK